MDQSARAMLQPDQGLTYLDPATQGLPLESTLRVTRDALQAWLAGTAGWVEWGCEAACAR